MAKYNDNNEQGKKYRCKYNEKSRENLKKGRTLNQRENFKELASKGGKQSVKRKQEFRHAKELLTDILSKDLSKEEVTNILGHDTENRNAYSVMLEKMHQVAVSGNVKAFEALRDTVGDKPTESVELTANVITDKDRQLLSLIAEKMTEKG